MAYYNRDGVKINVDLDNMIFLGEGNQGRVYHDGKITLKKYNQNCFMDEYRIKPKIFDFLKSLDNPHLMKIYDIYMNMDKQELLKYQNGKLDFIVDAYIAKYYKQTTTDILLNSKDYLLENVFSLELLCKILTENNIKMYDVKVDNTIITKDNIVLIDYDIFCETKDKITLYNKNSLFFLIYNLLLQYENFSKKVFTLFDFELSEKTNITDELSKKLKYVKRPIDYLK